MLLKSSRGGFVVVKERKKKTNPKLERRCGLDGMSPQPELGNLIEGSYSSLCQRLKLTFHFYTLWLIQ